MTVRSMMLNAIAACALLAAAMPATAGAYATPAAPPLRSGVSGLPDGRVYEEASPPNKYGNQVDPNRPTFAAADGNAVMYGGNGALAEASSNGVLKAPFVSERKQGAWVTRSAIPLPAVGVKSEEENVGIGAVATWNVPSADLSHLFFATWISAPYVGPPDEANLSNNVYIAGPNPLSEPEWVGRSQIEGAPGGLGSNRFSPMIVAGTSPDLKTIYFYYGGTLLPGASNLYVYREGVLGDAGLLPEGETSAGTAVPMAQEASGSGEDVGLIAPAAFDNQVSEDGSRIFFTRQDEAGTRELYVRVTASDGSEKTVLVSQSQLPGHLGEPASKGPLAVPSTEWMDDSSTIEGEGEGQMSPPSFAFASPDGSHVFFESVQSLTNEAPNEEATAKLYDFDVESESLEYLPGVSGSIVTVSPDGSSFVFEDSATSPFQLDLWTAGPGGGSITPIVQLPAVSPNACGSVLCVGPAYTSSDGSVIVFSTESPIPGFNDGGTHLVSEFVRGEKQIPNKEIFRYEVAAETLSCISCPPAGQAPGGSATISRLDKLFNGQGVTAGAKVATAGRGISRDGDRVFFETPEALVPQDINGMSDVYEWENGTLFLISTGRSPEASYFAGTSESGGDVFFMTSEALALSDTDGGYDMYDARIPRPGDNPPPKALPCSGDTCQGPPSVPNLLGAPPSATFSGVGNLTLRTEAKPAVKKTATKRKNRRKTRKAKKRRRTARKVRTGRAKRVKSEKKRNAGKGRGK